MRKAGGSPLIDDIIGASPLQPLGGWPTQARFWLEWGSSTAGQSLPAASSRFRVLYSEICSGRDDSVKDLNIPTQAKSGLEWATRPPALSSQALPIGNSSRAVEIYVLMFSVNQLIATASIVIFLCDSPRVEDCLLRHAAENLTIPNRRDFL